VFDLLNRPDGASGKTIDSGAGGMEFKSRAEQISRTLSTIRHLYNLDGAGPWRKAAEMGTTHS